LLGRYRDERRPDDFTELHRRYARELSNYLARYLGDATLAEDALQEVFLNVHTKCGLYQDSWPVRPWLYAIAIHKAVDKLRRARRHMALSLDSPHDRDAADVGALIDCLTGPEPEPFEQLLGEERRRWVRENVAQLPELHRQALVLAYYQGLPYAEIAELLDIPVGTVKSRLHGALARLRASADRLTQLGRL
jgi:RNA polymerase sigma-70 factor (ECF subfamily)